MSIKNLLLDCLFPKKCYGCQIGGTWLCQKCFTTLKNYQGEAPRALKNPKNLIIAGEYKDELLSRLITAFKFDFNQELADPLAAFLISTIDKKIMINSLSGQSLSNVLIIPVPLNRARLKWRGFNQSELLARKISNYYNWPLSLDLIKIKATAIQAGLKEEDRLTNQNGAFKWHGGSLKNQDVILIDDIITSGATLNEVETIIKASGARKIIKTALAKG